MISEEILRAKDAIIQEQKEEIGQLKFQLDQLRKLIYGTKRSRFVPVQDPSQGHLFTFSDEPFAEAADRTIRTYERKKKSKHPGRNKLPDHLPVEEIYIEPEEDTSGMVKIGEEITETIDLQEAHAFRKRYIRSKYANGDQVVIGKLPSRPIDKCVAESGLLAYLATRKFIDHMPYYRQAEGFKRDFNWEVSRSTINSWMQAFFELLDPLYEKHKEEVMSQQYLQADESPIKVLDKGKKTKTHQGYMWVYHGVEQGLVLFDYRKGRGQHGPKEMLAQYQGYLQTDGWQVYDKIAKSYPVTLVGCTAHARRYFNDARTTDPARAEFALNVFREIYAVERAIKKEELAGASKQHIRKEKIYPLMIKLKKWIAEERHRVLPKSPIGKAMNYYQKQWNKLENILLDARLELDNNLVENKIRLLALGRKNYLFAGNHKNARYIAMMYSFFATCKTHELNPREWLKDVLNRINEHPINTIHELLPQHWKSTQTAAVM